MAQKKRPTKRRSPNKSRPRTSQAREAAVEYRSETRRKGVVARESGPAKDRITVYLPLEVGEALRVYAARNRRELGQVVTDALRVYLNVAERGDGK